MATSIGVQETTRNILERIKRELAQRSFDATLTTLAREHDELKSRKTSEALLRRLMERRQILAAFAKRNGMRSVSVFGSVIHGDARPDSDVDLLVEFAPEKVPGLMRLSGMQNELSKILEVPVDLQTAGSLSKYFRDKVLAEAMPIYVDA